MNVGPPPLPPSARSPGESSFARQASNACLAAPIIIFVLACCVSSFTQNHHNASGRPLLLILGAVAAALLILGALLGILAMALAKPAERRSVTVRSLCGLMLLGLLVAMAVPSFMRARAQALRRQQSLQELHTAVDDIRAQAAASLTNGGKTTVDPQALLQSFNRVETNSTGDTAVLFQCTQRFLKRELAYQQAYTQAVSTLRATKVLGTEDLVQREQIPARKAVVQKFLDVNSDFKTFLVQSESNFRKELTDAGISETQVEEALKGFRRTWQPQGPLLIAIREADDRFGHELLETLDLLDSQWGHWRYDRSKRLVRFADHDALQQFNALMADIRQTSSDQAAAQKRLAAVLSRPTGSF